MGLWRLPLPLALSTARPAAASEQEDRDADGGGVNTTGDSAPNTNATPGVPEPDGFRWTSTRYSVRHGNDGGNSEGDARVRIAAIDMDAAHEGDTARHTNYQAWQAALDRSDPRAWQPWRQQADDASLYGGGGSETIDRLVLSGVPSALRGRVWWMCSGAAEKRAQASPIETYSALIRQIPLLSKGATMEIEKDLPRTFSHAVYNHPDRRARARTIGELRRVLQAYSLRNPVVGYCQSMNFLAAVLLQHLEEEEAFWVLVTVVEDLIPQFHTRNMLGSRTEQKVLGELVLQKLPRLHGHLEALGLDLEPFTLKWFLCLFLHTVPYDVALRVWDVFFYQGSHVLLRIGMTLLHLTQSQLLACDDVMDVHEVFKFSRDKLEALLSRYRWDRRYGKESSGDLLIRLAMDPATSLIGPISLEAIQELRQLYRNEVVADLKQLIEARGANALHGSMYANLLQEEASTEANVCRHLEAAQEMVDYDFVEEFAYYCDDISPTKHIHFSDLYDSLDATNMFVDVEYDGPMFDLPGTEE